MFVHCGLASEANTGMFHLIFQLNQCCFLIKHERYALKNQLVYLKLLKSEFHAMVDNVTRMIGSHDARVF